MAAASVLNRTISPALSRLRFQTVSVTLPCAEAGNRSNQRNRSMSGEARPSTPHLVTSCQSSGGSGGGVAAGVAAFVCAYVGTATSARQAVRRRRRRGMGIVFLGNCYGLDQHSYFC